MSTLLANPDRSKNNTVSIRAGRIPTLDGWRGLAILIVLIAHTGPKVYSNQYLYIGQHGVTIFFVLSGFLITSRLAEEQASSETISFRRFYLRRLFRLMPCAWTYLGLIWLANLSLHGRLSTLREMLGSLFFFRNYLDQAGEYLFTAHFWSLSIEEQFYLVWPLTLLLVRRRARWLALTAACAIALYRFMNWTALDNLPITASLGTQVRADALFIGCAAALWMPTIQSKLRPWMIAPLLAGLAFCGNRYHNLIPLHESILIAALIALTSLHPKSLLGSALETRWLVWIGTLSYSMYVWQQAVTLFPFHTATQAAFTLLLVFAIAAASYYLIERPCVRLGHQLTR